MADQQGFTQRPGPTIADVAAALAAAFPNLTPDEQWLVATIYRLLGTGRRIEPEMLATATGSLPAEIAARLDRWPGVYRDEAGRLVGFWGLATEAVTDHRLEFDGGSTWAWCALDPLFIVPLLGVEAKVVSTCPQSGQPVRLMVTPRGIRNLEPPEAVVSLLVPGHPFDADIRATFCHFVHFFASPAAAQEWTAQHPGTVWIAAADAFEVARRVNATVFPAAQPPA